MERLTEKVNGEYIHKVHKFCLNDCYDKLGKLEDIEQEIGIPLEVLFKALKDGIWTSGYEKRDSKKIWLRNFNGKLLLEVSNRFCFDLYYPEDYGKTWALTREELENAKD